MSYIKMKIFLSVVLLISTVWKPELQKVTYCRGNKIKLSKKIS